MKFYKYNKNKFYFKLKKSQKIDIAIFITKYSNLKII